MAVETVHEHGEPLAPNSFCFADTDTDLGDATPPVPLNRPSILHSRLHTIYDCSAQLDGETECTENSNTEPAYDHDHDHDMTAAPLADPPMHRDGVSERNQAFQSMETSSARSESIDETHTQPSAPPACAPHSLPPDLVVKCSNHPCLIPHSNHPRRLRIHLACV